MQEPVVTVEEYLAGGQEQAFPRTALEQRWREWLKTMLPNTFTRDFAPQHARFWEWLWEVERDVRPRPFVLCLPRHGGKSSNIEAGVMAVGARKLRDYGFYVSMTQPQADDHLTSIEPKLGADAVRAYYPDLSERHVGLHGSGTHWRRQRLWTKRGLIIDALGIDTAARGRKLGDQRPSLIIFDDIDDKDESAIARKKKMETMKSD